MSPDDLASALAQPGRASIPYVDRYNPDRPLVLECFRAQSHDPEKPVVIVQHGASRNGAEYCGAWIAAAEQHGLLIIAITFWKEAWPDAVTYNNGHVLDEVGSLRPRDGWSLAIPGCIFALLREAGLTQRDKTYPVRTRRTAIADRTDLRSGGKVSCAADGQEARAESERAQYRLSADLERRIATSRGARAQAEPERGLFLRRECAADDPAVITNRRFHGLNQWPGDLPGFRARALEYMQTLEALCRRLVLLYALALDLPADFFEACFAKPHMILRMSRYPVIDGEDETVASLVPHTDSGFMTLLPPNPVPGLSILLPSGRWIEAPGVEGAYVVNGGDILHHWTNERFLSTPHRVRNLSGQVRYAIPFFCDPDHDTDIECLPTCRSGDNPAKYPSIRFGDYALWFAAKSYQHMANESVLSDAVVAPGNRATARW